MKRILVTGAAGSIGSELVRQLAPHNKVYCLDINESGLFDVLEEYKETYWVKGRVGDIRNEKTLEDVFSDFKPHTVFHAAAYKHVPLMENTPDEAMYTNIIGTFNLIRYAKKYEVGKFIFISSDKAVQSSSIMGATKRVGEIVVKNQGAGYTVVRFGNVLGSRGSLIPIWQKQIDKGQAVTVTDPYMKRYFMSIDEAVRLVIEASKQSKGGEIWVMNMGEQVNILDMAKKIVHDSRSDVPIKITGIRPGELLEEKLMFDEEKRTAIKNDNFFVIK